MASSARILLNTRTLPAKSEILLVDDDPTVLFVVKECLRHSGQFDVSEFAHPVDALVAFEKEPHRYSMLITDYCMPEMTGEDLACRIHEQRPEIPVIGISGTPHKYRHPEIFAELLPKPFDMAALEATVERLLVPVVPPPGSQPEARI